MKEKQLKPRVRLNLLLQMVLNATGMHLSCLILFLLLTLTLKTTLHYFHYIPFHLKSSHMKLSRSIGDIDVGEFIVPVPYVKQVKELLELGESVGTQSRGLTQELISLLPVLKYKCNLFSRKKSRKESVDDAN
ncbi:probable protein phosphatase 2C 15 [Gossypium hirsutum]|uniref:Probable protein phosphatase 2C 15 n=1 Tax=Gossypium hirsutum TaxID=3635 RepID=A0A1U8MMZ4_GOSHI|nr:probable protein phosphatase 2C 15 [Gossypium hirsutum]